MSNIMYYVLVDKDSIEDYEKIKEIEKIEEIAYAPLPFSEKNVGIYLILHNKRECEAYIKNLSQNIREFFKIEQVGAEIRYTAFLDILGFSSYIQTEITNDDLAESFYDGFNEVIKHIQCVQKDRFESSVGGIEAMNNTKIKYSWVSDTFVISIEYTNELKNDDKNKIKNMMISRLSMIIASIHHFMACKFGFIVRGAISSKYSCITNNFILGEGVVEAAKLEKEAAIYPRVIFEKNIISSELYELMSLHYGNNDLNYITKDKDGYYFVNYLAMLQYIPPMIGKIPKVRDEEINQVGINLKASVIEKYQKLGKEGYQSNCGKTKEKYIWLNEYLDRVLSNVQFQKNIIEGVQNPVSKG